MKPVFAHATQSNKQRAVWTLAALGIGLVATLTVFALGRPVLPRINPNDADQVEVGRRLYRDSCASCHGPSLEGQAAWQMRLPNGRLPAPPHDASGHTWHHSDEVLFRITKHGPKAYPAGYETDMPPFADRLTDSEIAAVLAFIKSTWPADVRTRQARTDAVSRQR